MGNISNKIKGVLSILMLTFVLSGCLITEVDQSTEVEQNATFTTTITITDQTADSTPYLGAVAVLVPDDWVFLSGTYDSQVGAGSFILDPNVVPVYGNIDSVLEAPDDMQWVKLLSDSAYANEANVVHEATLNFTVGTMTGEFPIGYMVTKNSADLLDGLNTTDEDSDAAWADTSMNHMVTVKVATGIEDEVVETKYSLNQNYPNPFNPSTSISFNLTKQEHASLIVYDALGNRVATIVNKVLPAGLNTFNFDASGLSSGAYIYQLKTESFMQARKMLLLK